MNRILRFVAIALGVAACWSCCLDADYNYDDVTPPAVSLNSPSIVGYVTNKAGEPIAGATVKVGPYTATTDATGYYVIPNVDSGTYDVTISADGYIQHLGDIDVDSPSDVFLIVEYSTTLAKADNVATIVISAGGSGEGTVTSEHIKSNDPAGIHMTTTFRSGTVNKNVTFYLTPIYDESQAVSVKTKAGSGDKERLLVGATLSCSDPDVVFNEPFTIDLYCDDALVKEVTIKHLVNGVWQNMEFSSKNGVISVKATQLGSYAIFLPFVITEKPRKEDLVFTPQSVWDNLYGNAAITAGDVHFQYYSGTRLNSVATDVLSALLIEKLAYHYGTVYQQHDGTYPLNIRLPIGTRLVISGYQLVTDAYATYATWSVDATNFGDTRITAKISNRQHNGGSGGRF